MQDNLSRSDNVDGVKPVCFKPSKVRTWKKHILVGKQADYMFSVAFGNEADLKQIGRLRCAQHCCSNHSCANAK